MTHMDFAKRVRDSGVVVVVDLYRASPFEFDLTVEPRFSVITFGSPAVTSRRALGPEFSPLPESKPSVGSGRVGS
jgi:hypothetical protein